MKKTFLLFLIALTASCDKENINIKKAKANEYLKHKWEPVIDSLNGQYFQGVDVGWNGQLYANYWKGWNGSGPILKPATIISDDGATWRRVTTDNPIDGFWTYLKRHKEIILAGTPDKGLYFSLDNGLQWTRFSNFDWKWPEIIRSNNERIVISDFRQSKIFISEDGAMTWREIFPKYMRVVDLQADKIVAMSLGKSIESKDWGRTWTYDSTLVVQEKEQLNSIGMGSINGQMIVAVTKGIFKKNADKKSWTNIGKSLIHNDMNCMFIDRDNIIIQTLTDGNFYFSNNLGQTWSEFGQGLPGFSFQGIASKSRAERIVKRGSYLFITTSDGFFKRKVD